ncbi:MAG TPA: hypothetical protein VGN26_03930 [Armatimonadota bacterium]|jgi:hypothetical protein
MSAEARLSEELLGRPLSDDMRPDLRLLAALLDVTCEVRDSLAELLALAQSQAPGEHCTESTPAPTPTPAPKAGSRKKAPGG